VTDAAAPRFRGGPAPPVHDRPGAELHTATPPTRVWVVATMSRERLGRRVSISTTMTEEVFK